MRGRDPGARLGQPPSRTEQAVGMAVLALLAGACFLVLRPFLVALLWAVIIAFSSWGLYRRLEQRLGGRRGLAAGIMTAAVGILMVLPLVVLGLHLAESTRHAIGAVHDWLDSGLGPPPAWLGRLPVVGDEAVGYWQGVASGETEIASLVKPHLRALGEWLVGLAQVIGIGIGELVLSLFVAFFIYRDGAAAAARLRAIALRLAGERGIALMTVAGGTIKGVVYGILGTNLIQAVLAGIGFRLAGVPGAFILAFLLFFATTIPVVPMLIWVPATLWVLHTGTIVAASLLGAWCLLVFVVLEHVLRPYLISRGASLPFLLVLLGMLGGLAAFGFLGIFLGPTLLSVGYALLTGWSTGGEPAPVTAEKT